MLLLRFLILLRFQGSNVVEWECLYVVPACYRLKKLTISFLLPMRMMEARVVFCEAATLINLYFNLNLGGACT